MAWKSLLVTVALVASLSFWRLYFSAPQPWTVADVPVSWWAWRTHTPGATDLHNAMQQTRTQALFLRAGQIDYERGELRRIREVEGLLPRAIELHLVYNATRDLLSGFEKIRSDQLARTIIESYRNDLKRAACDGAAVAGLQLDFDVPTRLLPRYAELLASTRGLLEPGKKLSITGLPTWAADPALAVVLSVTDFWIPQLYGAEVPQRLNQPIPIASPSQVARVIERIRKLDHPFQAGLSAWGWAILYSTTGELIELRGDLDPALIAAHPDLEQVERHAFEPRRQHDLSLPSIASEWRYVYRARRDCVLDGLVVREGESLLLDLPTAEALRASARAVRALAGPQLLGICVFRLPVEGDHLTLTAGEIAAALADSATRPSASLAIAQNGRLDLTLVNDGNAGAVLGSEAVAVILRVPPGRINGIARVDGFSGFETFCGLPESESLRPCSTRRAGIIRLSAGHWRPGARHRIAFSYEGDLPRQLSAAIVVRTDDGRVWQDERLVTLESMSHE